MSEAKEQTPAGIKREQLPKAAQDAITAGKKILELTGEDGRTYYFQKPTVLDMKRFIGTVTKGKTFQAVNDLLFEKALHPTKDQLEAEFEEMPGRMVALNNELQSAIGMNETLSTKKF
ncbi:hypothetical protein [Geobacter sp. SVR]|uniref:DUF6848 family protein n=1 Tax=Geobacter sp. SVR TaxID=2495594 RepID=UPI00143EFFA0|nr:hypothetical protein [Geobacter sp. SVR]BCS54562.1 hypothetical protein GSVR_28700 [Geobacter sp. SVR]GCF86931.1 hypothetical protein GSbR_35310 [Geobacter sp. SVR]